MSSDTRDRRAYRMLCFVAATLIWDIHREVSSSMWQAFSLSSETWRGATFSYACQIDGLCFRKHLCSVCLMTCVMSFCFYSFGEHIPFAFANVCRLAVSGPYLVRRVSGVPGIMEVDNNPRCLCPVHAQQILRKEVPLWAACITRDVFIFGPKCL